MKSLRRIQAIVYKEITQLKRDSMTARMIVMIPLIQLLLFGYAINTNIRHIPVALVDHSDTALSRALVQTVSATQVIEFTEHYLSAKQAEAAIVAGHVRAALIIPHDLAGRLVRSPSIGRESPPSSDELTSRPLASWIVDGSDTMIAAAIKGLRGMPMTELLQLPPNRMTPTFEVALFFNPEQRSAVNIVPGLVAIILTMTMILFTSAAIVREREFGNMEMIINTPVRPVELMLGKIVPFIFIGALQVAIILGLGHVFFQVPINGSWVQLCMATLLFISASLSLGLVISTVATSQLQAMQMTVFVLLPSILLSGFMFPYEGMPVPAQYIAEVFPATPFMRVIRGVVLRDATVVDLSHDMIRLAVFTLAGLAIATIRFKKNLG